MAIKTVTGTRKTVDREKVKKPKKKAWDAFSKYIRLRDALETTGTPDYLICCTCGKQYPAFGKGCAQAGHFLPGRGNAILFREDCVHGQCYNCNINLKGNWPNYLEFMIKKYGQNTVDTLMNMRHLVVKYAYSDLIERRDRFKEKYDHLLTEGVNQ